MSTRPEPGLAPGTRVTVVIDGRVCAGVVQHYEPDPPPLWAGLRIVVIGCEAGWGGSL